jgi:FkbM family methyltransferase
VATRSNPVLSRSRDVRALLRRLRAAVPAPAPAPPVQEAPEEPGLPYYLERDARDGENMRRLITFLLRPDDNCVDVGSNAGVLLNEMCRVAPEGRHVAFEPIPELADELRRRFPAVEVRTAAASRAFGESSFSHFRKADGWSGLKYRPLPGGDDGEVVELTVELEPIDEVVDAERPLALVKIDVEGAEQQVIEGALRTLKRHGPTVIFEHGLGSANHFGTEPEDIWALLAGEVGYRIFDLDGNGPYDLDEFKRTYHAKERVNFVAHR